MGEAIGCYHIVAVNGIAKDAAAMAEELCQPRSACWVECWQSGYAGGLGVAFEKLTAGYNTEKARHVRRPPTHINQRPQAKPVRIVRMQSAKLPKSPKCVVDFVSGVARRGKTYPDSGQLDRNRPNFARNRPDSGHPVCAEIEKVLETAKS